MKRIFLTLAIIIALLIPAQSQEREQKITELEQLEQTTGNTMPSDTLILEEEETVLTEDDISRLKIGEMVTVEETGDETIIRIGRKASKILADEVDTGLLPEMDEDDVMPGRSGRYFDGHLGGLEFGFNGYSTGRWISNDLPLEGWLDLHTAKSSSFNIIMPAVNLGLSRHFGIVAALGINYNNYRFDGNNSVAVDDGGILTPVYPAGDINYEKSKLTTVYGILPVMLELQIPVSHSKTINLGAGIIGGVKLGSHTKVVYFDDGKQKDKNRDDFNLNVLRYGVTARAGYEMIQVYGTCYLSPMFEKGKGPELYPFEVGIALTFND